MRAACLTLSFVVAASPLAAQREGFIATLGVDTVPVEQFMRQGARVSGTTLVRTPAFRVTRWSMTFDSLGSPLMFETNTTDAGGTPVLNGVSGKLTYAADTIVRDGYAKDERGTSRVPAPKGAYPSPSIPYIGTSYLMYERALTDARRRAQTSADSSV